MHAINNQFSDHLENVFRMALSVNFCIFHYERNNKVNFTSNQMIRTKFLLEFLKNIFQKQRSNDKHLFGGIYLAQFFFKFNKKIIYF